MALQNPSWVLHSPVHGRSSSSKAVAKFSPSGQWKGRERSVLVSGFPSLRREKSSCLAPPLRCSLDVIAPTVGTVTEVNKDTFWPIVKGAGEKLVVLDMYTQWCGPCKVIAPKFKELSEQHLDVIFLKLDCNEANKPLAKELGIKVVPTFKIFKNGECATEIRGAKYDALVEAIATAKNS